MYYADYNRKFSCPNQTTYMLFYCTLKFLKEHRENVSKRDVYEFIGWHDGSSHDYWAAFSRSKIIKYERHGRKSYIIPQKNNILDKWLNENEVTPFEFLCNFKKKTPIFNKHLNVFLLNRKTLKKK